MNQERLKEIKADCEEAKKLWRHVAPSKIFECIAEIERLRKRFKWIAQQPCERHDENGQSTCDQTGDCITEWCYPCYSKNALEE